MTTVERTALIGASPEAVLAMLADFESISAWAPNVDHSCLLGEPGAMIVRPTIDRISESIG